jgi:hypothetical protein
VQFPDHLPDVFIRRSEVPRITNSLSGDLITSRRTRLQEATSFLEALPNAKNLLDAFEGQYFVEGEFLLFNHDAPAEPIEAILSDWEAAFGPQAHVRRIVRAYFEVGVQSRRGARLALRIARRLAIRMLPRSFFPRGGSFEIATAKQSIVQQVRRRLAIKGEPA